MGSDITGLGGTAPGVSAGPADGSDDHLISLPGRSPVLDAAQLGVLRGYGSEYDVAAGDVLFADGVISQDIEDTVNPRWVTVFSVSGRWAGRCG
jgi:hypothetical protein